MWPIASAKKSGSGSCSPATSRNALLCHQDRSRLCSRIWVCISVQSATSTGYYMPMARPTAAVVPGHHSSRGQCHACGPQTKSSVELGHHLSPHHHHGVWLYLYLVIDVWSRKIVAWDVAQREDPAIAADLVSRACLRERISKRRQQPLILHADNGNAMRAATL